MFLCTTTNSALTTTIVGQLKNVFTIIFGFFLLGGAELHFLNALGLVLNSIGGVGYSAVKYQESVTKAVAAENKLQV
jgi:solute carrier family 35 protein